MFVEFREPDQPGAYIRENSAEYSQGIMLDDEWLGKIWRSSRNSESTAAPYLYHVRPRV